MKLVHFVDYYSKNDIYVNIDHITTIEKTDKENVTELYFNKGESYADVEGTQEEVVTKIMEAIHE